MKKILFSTVLFVSLAAVSNAQSFHLGGKIGANLSKVSGQAFKDGFNLGYQAGGFAEIDFTNEWGIQPEVLFNQINSKHATSANDVLNGWKDNTGDIKLQYLTVPILLRYNVNKILTFNLGPQFGILINQDKTLWNNGKDAFKKGDLSAVGGVTVRLSVLRVFGRYNIGIANLNDTKNQDAWRSQQFQVGVGLSL